MYLDTMYDDIVSFSTGRVPPDHSNIGSIQRGAVVQWLAVLALPLITLPTGVRIPLGPGAIIRCKNQALYIRDCVSLCRSDETLKAVGPFYLVSMPGEVKDPTSLHWKCVTCRGLHILA